MARAEGDSDASTSSEAGAVSGSGSFETDAQGDPLADAVQSALRSVYGDDSANGDGDFRNVDEPDATDGPVLQWAGAATAGSLDQGDPFEPVEGDDANVFKAPGQDSAIDEETTEAVLSYLYEHMGSDNAGQLAGRAKVMIQRTIKARIAQRDDDFGGGDEWRDSGFVAHSGSTRPAATTNYDGYLADRDTAPAYAASERDRPRLFGHVVG